MVKLLELLALNYTKTFYKISILTTIIVIITGTNLYLLQLQKVKQHQTSVGFSKADVKM